jgi:hypothetical protein
MITAGIFEGTEKPYAKVQMSKYAVEGKGR